jgi:hypothetical protein
MKRKPKPRTLGDYTGLTVKALRSLWMLRILRDAGQIRTDRFASASVQERIDNIKTSYHHGKESRQTR